MWLSPGIGSAGAASQRMPSGSAAAIGWAMRVVLRLPQVASASDVPSFSMLAIASSIAASCTARQSALPGGSQPGGCSSRRRAITAGQREVAREKPPRLSASFRASSTPPNSRAYRPATKARVSR